MKVLIPKLVVMLTIFISVNSLNAASATHGVVLFDEPPATYVQILEFASIRESNVRFSTVVLPNGQKREIPRDGIVAVIDYPPEPSATVSDADAGAATQKIHNLIQTYPQYRLKLSAALSKWQNALAFSRKNQKASGQTTSSVSGPVLEIDGVKYRDVVLTAFTGKDVAITHSDGVASIPAAKLTAAQITALNATSTSVRIDPAHIIQQPPTSAPLVSSNTGTPTPAVPAVAPSGDSIEIAGLKEAVAKAEATLKELQAEEADINRRIKLTPNQSRNTPEYLQLGRRSSELNDQRQQAQFRYDGAVQNLRNGEQTSNAKVLKSGINAYKETATLAPSSSDWDAVVKEWTDKVAKQSKAADAAREAFVNNRNASNPTQPKPIPGLTSFSPTRGDANSTRLMQIWNAEKEKLQIAEKALAEAKRRAGDSARQREAEMQRNIMAEKERAEAEKYAEAKQNFKNLPVNSEAFVPPPAVADASPTYAETIEFLDQRFGLKVGFGEQSRKLIIRYSYAGVTYAFDPKDMNPEITIATNVNAFNVEIGPPTIVLGCRNAQRKIEQFRPSGEPRMISQIPIYVGNSIEADKLSKALSHLVSILGATKEAFSN